MVPATRHHERLAVVPNVDQRRRGQIGLITVPEPPFASVAECEQFAVVRHNGCMPGSSRNLAHWRGQPGDARGIELHASDRV